MPLVGNLQMLHRPSHPIHSYLLVVVFGGRVMEEAEAGIYKVVICVTADWAEADRG